MKIFEPLSRITVHMWALMHSGGCGDLPMHFQ
jgi:hypothetical protein